TSSLTALLPAYKSENLPYPKEAHALLAEQTELTPLASHGHEECELQGFQGQLADPQVLQEVTQFKSTKEERAKIDKGLTNGKIRHGLKKPLDFDEVFAPVARIETVRLILALAAYHGWQVHHLDVKSAFLHRELKEEVYVTQPEGFIQQGNSGKVYKLTKALYGLRQAPRAWNVKLDQTLKSLDFKKCNLEQAVYTKRSKTSTLIVEVYVDDLITAGTPRKEIDLFKSQMEDKFEMSDLGLLAYYLRIEVTQTGGVITIRQTGAAGGIGCSR
nr:ribonuclease H-like domain, reverse transcriptase, RNA-dependent DNA polymerase [Tanacetum cinerariifolium]